jgi:hypothetical protein
MTITQLIRELEKIENKTDTINDLRVVQVYAKGFVAKTIIDVIFKSMEEDRLPPEIRIKNLGE